MNSSPPAAVVTAAATTPGRPLRARFVGTMLGFGALAVVVCAVAPLVGTTTISLGRAFDRSIPFQDKRPRSLSAGREVASW